MPRRVVDLLAGWMGRFSKLRGGNCWKAIPLCLMWIIWLEWNNWAFEVTERTAMELKMIGLRSLFDLMAVMPIYLRSIYIFSLDSCNMS